MPLSLFLLALLSLWLLGWAVTSYEVIRFIKTCPDEDDPDFLLWDLEDQLPLLVTVLLVAWPVVCVRVVIAVWGARR